MSKLGEGDLKRCREICGDQKGEEIEATTKLKLNENYLEIVAVDR